LGFSALPQEPTDPYWKTMAIAIINTLLVAGVSILIASLAGALLAFLAISAKGVWGRLAQTYVAIFRNVPLVLQALFWFTVITHAPPPRHALYIAGVAASNRGISVPFMTVAGIVSLVAGILTFVTLGILLPMGFSSVRRYRRPIAIIAALAVAWIVSRIAFPGESIFSVPTLRGFNFAGGVTLPTELAALLLALSMFGAAYIAEIVRGGLAAVPKGVLEAAHTLALPLWVVEIKIRAPIALRAILPPLSSQYTTMIKATSIGLAIGYTDLFAVTIRSINQSGHTIALLCVMTASYIVLNQIVVSIMNALNKRFEIPGYGPARL
jgi:ABC-type amino acid transport system permease subunit